MSRKAKAEAVDKKVVFAQLRKVWTEIAQDDWLHLVAELAPAAGFIRSGGNIKGRCPFHDDPSPSFVITPHKGMVKCFGCQKSFFSPIGFIAALRKTSFADTILFMRKRFGLKAAIPEALYEKLRDHEIYQSFKMKLCQFFCEELFKAISEYPMETSTDYYWAKPTIDYLLTRRLGDFAPNEPRALGADANTTGLVADPYGIWDAITSNQLLGVFPPLVSVANKFGENSEEYKFFCNYFGQYATAGFTFVGNLVFPMHDEPGSVCRFKMRGLNSDRKAMFFVDDAYEAEMGGFRGFYGMHYYRTILGLQEDQHSFADTAVMMEGEFDTLACIAQQIHRTSPDFIAFAMGGASVLPLDRLVSYGITRVKIVADRDKGGDNVTQNVLERTKTDKLSFMMFEWPDEYATWRDPSDPARRIKDPDEAIRWLGYPRLARYVNDNDTYLQPQKWCFEQATKELANVPADDVAQQGRVAMEWGKLLRDPHACNFFCEDIEKYYGLSKTILFRDIRAKDENEEAFVERLSRVIQEHFHLVGVQNAESRKRLLTLWHKEKRTTDHIVLNDERSIETAFSRYFGTLYEFITDKVGDPSFMAAEGDDASSFSITMRVKKYREYLNFALLRLTQGLPSLDHAPTKAQGMHYIKTIDNEMHSYVVNGRDVFHMVHGDAGKFEVKTLDGPSHNGVVFDNSGQAWLHSVKTPQDIIDTKVDLVETFLRIREMINSAWTFRFSEKQTGPGKDVDSIFLAAYAMALPLMPVFTRQTALMFNGEAGTGKSRFTSGFIGGTNYPKINIIAHALTMSGYTAASIRQKQNNCSLTLCLEEFEDYGGNDAKSITVRKVLEMFRDLIAETEVHWSIGTTNGESKTYNLRFPVACAAIKPLRDAASLSRFIAFESVKDLTRIDPQTTLLDKYGADGIAAMRHALAVGLYRHMPRVKKLQVDIEKEFAPVAMLPSYAESRFREAMFPILTMLKLIAEDAESRGLPVPINYKEFAYAFCESRKDQLARLKTSSENEQIFESLLSSSIQIANSDDNRVSWVTTIRVMLGDLNKLDEINRTKKGVYFFKEREWLVVNWIEATQGVLANTRYRGESTNFLKQVSERSPRYIADDEVKKANVLNRMIEWMGPCQPMEHISVFSVRHLLEAARENALRQTSGAPPQTSSGIANADTAEQVDDIVV